MAKKEVKKPQKETPKEEIKVEKKEEKETLADKVEDKLAEVKEELHVPDSFFPVPEEPTEVTPTPKKKKSKKDKKNKDKKLNRHGRVKLKYRTKENDIKYQGPLSYRYLRILAWLSMAIAQLGIVFSLASFLDIQGKSSFDAANAIVNFFAALPLALFMLANFGIILRNRHNFKYLFIFYGGVMLGLYAVANIVVLHYVYGSLHAINPETSFQSVALQTGTFLASSGTSGYIFNLFVDLFLCVLTVFFFFYNPRSKAFQGRRVIIFRLFVLIPIAYEAVSIYVKNAAMLGKIEVPSYFFFLLTSKPPLTFAAFFIVTLILKIRERKFLREFDHDVELLEEHNNTNAHSFRTSITISIVFTVVAGIDILVLLGYLVATTIKLGLDDYAIFTAYDMASNIGFGSSASLALISPLVLLYSYTRTHKNKKLDSFLPFLGIAFMLFTIIEGCYLVLRIMLPQMMDGFLEMAGDMEGMEEGLEGLEEDSTVYEAVRSAASIMFRGYR